MITIGPFVIRLYGILVGLGILVGFWVAARMARAFSVQRLASSVSGSDVWDALWWAVIPGFVGARLYHVIDLWEYYRANFVLIPAVWTGGMGIFGAIIGGVLGLWLFSRRKGIDFFRLADLAAFGLPVAQAIGRWGNFFNKELYGRPTDLPWGLSIPPENRLPQVAIEQFFHPLFLYESLYSVFVFGVLLLIWRMKGATLATGSYFFVYLMLYGVGRFFLEGLRIDPWVIGGINAAQAVSFASVMVGVSFLYSKNRK